MDAFTHLMTDFMVITLLSPYGSAASHNPPINHGRFHNDLPSPSTLHMLIYTLAYRQPSSVDKALHQRKLKPQPRQMATAQRAGFDLDLRELPLRDGKRDGTRVRSGHNNSVPYSVLRQPIITHSKPNGTTAPVTAAITTSSRMSVNRNTGRSGGASGPRRQADEPWAVDAVTIALIATVLLKLVAVFVFSRRAILRWNAKKMERRKKSALERLQRSQNELLQIYISAGFKPKEVLSSERETATDDEDHQRVTDDRQSRLECTHPLMDIDDKSSAKRGPEPQRHKKRFSLYASNFLGEDRKTVIWRSLEGLPRVSSQFPPPRSPSLLGGRRRSSAEFVLRNPSVCGATGRRKSSACDGGRSVDYDKHYRRASTDRLLDFQVHLSSSSTEDRKPCIQSASIQFVPGAPRWCVYKAHANNSGGSSNHGVSATVEASTETSVSASTAPDRPRTGSPPPPPPPLLEPSGIFPTHSNSLYSPASRVRMCRGEECNRRLMAAGAAVSVPAGLGAYMVAEEAHINEKPTSTNSENNNNNIKTNGKRLPSTIVYCDNPNSIRITSTCRSRRQSSPCTNLYTHNATAPPPVKSTSLMEGKLCSGLFANVHAPTLLRHLREVDTSGGLDGTGNTTVSGREMTSSGLDPLLSGDGFCMQRSRRRQSAPCTHWFHPHQERRGSGGGAAASGNSGGISLANYGRNNSLCSSSSGSKSQRSPLNIAQLKMANTNL